MRVRLWPDALVLIAGLTTLTASGISAYELSWRRLGVTFHDWRFYSGAVTRWLAGEAIYPGARISTLATEAAGSYSYPPSSVPFMLPFASWPVGLVLWETLIVLTLLSGIWVVMRAGWPNRTLIAFGVATTGLAIFRPAMEGIAVGNVNIATAGLLGWVWVGSRHAVPAIALLTIVKVFPLALAAPIGVRALSKSALIALAISIVTLPFVGVDSWVDYATGLRMSEPLCGDPSRFNPSFACALTPLLGPLIAKWAGLAVSAALVLVALRARSSFIRLSAAAGAIMAPATELHAHYFTLVFVLVCIALVTAWRRRPDVPR